MESQETADREFARWLEQEESLVGAFLRRRCPKEASADLVQETLLKAWRERASFDRKRPLRAWLLAIAGRVGIDWRRRQRRAANLAEPAADLEAHPDPGLADLVAGTIRAERLARLRVELDRLDEPARSVALAFYRDGRSLADITKDLGIPLNTVK